MLDFCYALMDRLPWDWAQFLFMKHALLALLMVLPVLSALGVVVVSNRMAFFSDVIGHAALTGLAIGMVCGLGDPGLFMLVFAALLALLITGLKHRTGASPDTVMGVVFAATVSLGVVLLSRGGQFSKYTGFLIGDILTLSPGRLGFLAVLSLMAWMTWAGLWRSLMLSSLSPELARSRGVRVLGVESGFAVLVAVVVTACIPLVGLLVINSMLILPAATARLWARGVRAYVLISIGVGLGCGVSGLLLSFYIGTSAGATCALLAAICYGVSIIGAGFRRR